MADESGFLQSFSKIFNTVNTRDIQLWSDEAFIKNAVEQLQKLDCKIENLEDAASKLEKENEKLEQDIKKEDETIEKLNASIKSDRKMLVALEEQNRLLEMERQNWLKKYRAAEKKYTHEFEEYRNELIEKNPDYNRLIEKKIEEKKLRINLMWLQQNTEQNKLIQKQSAAIQKKLFYADIIEFAKANVEYVKSKKLHEKITEMEATEKGLLEKLSRLHIAKAKREMEEQAALKARANSNTSYSLFVFENNYKATWTPNKSISVPLRNTNLKSENITCFKTKQAPVHDDVLNKKARYDSPKINVLSNQIVTASPLLKKTVTFKSNQSTIVPNVLTADTKPILKQHKENEAARPSNAPVQVMQAETSKTTEHVNRLEKNESKSLIEPKKRPSSYIDTSMFSFTNKPQTVEIGNVTKQDNIEKSAVIVSATNLSSSQGMQKTIFPPSSQNLCNTEAVNSHLNKPYAEQHLDVQKQQTTTIEETVNLSVPNFEKSSEWINSSQIDYPDILSDTDLQHETTFLNASVMNYFEGSQQCVYPMEPNSGPSKSDLETVPFKMRTNTENNSTFRSKQQLDFFDLL